MSRSKLVIGVWNPAIRKIDGINKNVLIMPYKEGGKIKYKVKLAPEEKKKKEKAHFIWSKDHDDDLLSLWIGKDQKDLPKEIMDWYPIIKDSKVAALVSASEKGVYYETIPSDFTPKIEGYTITEDKFIKYDDINNEEDEED